MNLIVINALVWFFLHMGVSKWALSLRWERFEKDNWIFCPRSFENQGRFYIKFLKIKRWKDKLPDGASFFKGNFSKSKIESRHADYLNRFIAETRRGELAHWLQLLSAPLFVFWNPLWAVGLMMVYALGMNGPCIAVQRYNRIILMRVLHRRQRL